MWRVKSILLFLLLLISGGPGFAQAKDEGELKKQAARAFEEENYALAFKNYSTLLANYPKDPDYNYRLGVCAIYVEPEKKKAVSYLQAAARNPKDIDKEVFFYLGKAYHLNYQFDEAIKFYTQYKQEGSSSMQKKLQVDREIQCAKNGKRLLSNLKELVVLDRKQLSQADYFRSYDLKDIRGKLLAKPSDFATANDKKKKDKSIIYLPPAKDQLYFASYGTGDNKDIFIVRRLPDGNWGKPESLKGAVNTEYDEDYPFLHPNGTVLYFASKGHNSMGGYDVFKSEFDEGARAWKTPVNLEFPINSPNDDYLFVTDSLEKIAFLASTRQSPMGKVDVYRILTERRAAEFAFISGTIIKKNSSQNLPSKIKVKNIETGEDAGTFTTEANGEYNIKLANGGKFIFTVETPGLPTQSEGVNLPTSYSYKPYRQTIDYDNQKLIITNFFDVSDQDDNNYTRYLALIEEKAKMNVNASDFDINPENPLANSGNSNNTGNNPANDNISASNDTTGTETTAAATNTTTASEENNANAGNTNLSNKQLIDIAYEDAKEAQDEASELKKDATTAFTAANSKQDQATATKQELQEVQAKIDAEKEPVKKQELMTQAEQLKENAALYDKQAATANSIAQQLEVDAAKKQKEADLNLQYAKALEEADKTKNNKEAIAKLENLQAQLEELASRKSQSNALVESIKADARNKEQELNNAEKKQETINQEEADLKAQIAEVDKEIGKTNDKDLLDNLNAQKEELNTDLAGKQKESQINQAKINTLKGEAEALNSQAEYAVNVAGGNATETTTPAGTDNATDTNAGTVAANNSEINGGTSNTGTNGAASDNGTATSATTNTVTTTSPDASNTDEPVVSASTAAFNEKAKEFETNVQNLNSAGNTLENNRQKAEVLKQYLQATESQISTKNQELAKAKTTADKAAINEEIKALTAKKADIETDVRLVTTQVEQQEKQAAAFAANNPNTNTSDNTNTGIPTRVTDTAQAKIVKDADDPRMQDINTLITQSQSTTTEEKQVLNSVVYSDNQAAQLQKQADEKMAEVHKNTAALKQQLSQLKTEVARENAGANDRRIQDLSKQGNDLYAQAVQLRQNARNMSGSDKQNALNKIFELEKEAAGFKYHAAKLQYESDDNNYAANKQAIEQLLAQNTNTQAKELAQQAEKTKIEAVRLREEAEAQQEVQAKIGALSNADEREKEALKKQEEALALLNPNVNTGTSSVSKEQQVEDVKDKLSQQMAASVEALKLLAEANKAEYSALRSEVDALESKNGARPEAGSRKAEAEATFGNATEEYNKLGTLQDDEQKRDLLLAVNTKYTESIKQLREAKEILGNETVASADTNASGTTTNNSSAATNTVIATGTNTPSANAGNLSPEQTVEVKNSSEYQRYTAYQQEIAKYNDSAANDEKAAQENRAQYEQLKAEAEQMPAGEAKGKKEQEAATYKSKADSLQEVANSTRMLADTKKQESHAFVQTLDAATYSNIATVAATETATTNNEAPRKYANYSETFRTSANNKDESLANLKVQGSSPEGLQQQNAVILAYIADIDKEVDAKKAEQAAAQDAGDKLKIAQQIKNLQTRKIELTNEKNNNDNALRMLAGGGNNTGNNTAANTNENNTSENTADTENNETTETAANNTTAGNNNTSAATGNAGAPRKVSTSNEVNANGFEIRNTNAYSAANPIPLNEKLPEGLVFRVQIGAFKKPIPQDLFAGLAPIGAESTDFGFIRYQVGMFTDYQKANAVRNDLRKLKYNDAFVVAYRNGRRISLTEALDSLARIGADVTTNVNATAGITATSNIPVNPEANNNTATTITPAAVSGELNKTDGLLFTVQVGVYTSNVSADRLLNLKPIYTETLPTGAYRYTAGVYNNIERAKADRLRVNELGIRDAFVSAYLNGQRIAIGEAIDKMNAGGISLPEEKPIQFGGGIAPLNNVPTTGTTANDNTPVKPFNNGVTEGPAPTPENGVKTTVEGITFKVQIGAYRKQVPQEVANDWMKVRTWPVQYIQADNLYIYTIGSFTEAKFAEQLRKEVRDLGITDAFIVVFKDGKKLSLAEGAPYIIR